MPYSGISEFNIKITPLIHLGHCGLFILGKLEANETCPHREYSIFSSGSGS